MSDTQQSSVTTPIKINQDANIHVTELTTVGQFVTFDLQPGRQAYVLCIDGDVDALNQGGVSASMNKHDAAELFGPNTFTVTSTSESSHLLMVEMNFSGVGRTDL